jgi:two-component system KDP operon response regulator KdpE
MKLVQGARKGERTDAVAVQRRVLVVEDDPAVARMLKLALRSSGFEVTEATHGARALMVLDEKPPDAVVLDLGLPDGMGGAVLNRLQRFNKDGRRCVAWVAVSAMDRQEATAAFGPLGPNFIPKPFNPWELVTRLQELMDECLGR